MLKSIDVIDDINRTVSNFFIIWYKLYFNYSLTGSPNKKIDTTILENEVKSICVGVFCSTIQLIFIMLFTINVLNAFSIVLCLFIIVYSVLYVINAGMLYEYRKEHLLKGIKAYNDLVK